MNGGDLSVDIERRLGALELAVRFEAAPAGVTALFGVSGAGKSATLAAVAGALRPDRGRIVIGDEVLFDTAAGVDVLPERRAIGWVHQDARLFPHLSVAANLRYGLARARGRPRTVGFDEVCAVLGIAPLLGRRPRDLSGGERQRVAIGRALLSQPRLLLMDEPLAALDHARKAEILPLLERLGGTFRLPILYVTHALAEVVRLADRLVVIEAGRVTAQGSLVEVLARGEAPLLAGRADAGVALEAVVVGHDAARGLTRLAIGEVDLLTPRLDRAEGARVRAVVLARDVLLARVRPQAISARNVLPATIEQLTPRPDGTVLARLRLGEGATLLSALTRDAVDDLALAPGVAVWAVLKSVAVEGAGGGAGGGLLALFDE